MTEHERASRPRPPDLSPPGYVDPIIELYMRDVDRALLRENLELTHEERLRKFERVAAFAVELREAGRRHREGR